MNRTPMIALTAIAALLVGIVIGTNVDTGETNGTNGAAANEREILYWVAPMDSSYRRDAPGKSPMGMDLVPVYADQTGTGATTVSIDPAVTANLGIRTASAERSSLPRLIDATAQLTYNEDTRVHVHTRVEGWIERLAATAAGDPVEAGDLLFELYSPTLVNAQQEYLAAARSGSASLAAASRDRLLALGMTGREIERLGAEKTVRQLVSVFAETSGVVARLGVREGMYVTPDTEVLSIARLDEMWVLADILERQATWVESGQAATITLDAFPGESFDSVVDYVYPELDARTRTLTARIRLSNAEALFRPGMFGRVRIAGRETGAIVHVPREAVVRTGHGNRVVVDTGDGRFEVRRVVPGIESGDRIAIRRGLAAGERVVVSGQFLIDSESNVDSALARFGPAGSAGDGGMDMHQGHHGDSEAMDGKPPPAEAEADAGKERGQ